MKKVKEIQLTQHEWQDALRVPSPYRKKKNFSVKKNIKIIKKNDN